MTYAQFLGVFLCVPIAALAIALARAVEQAADPGVCGGLRAGVCLHVALGQPCSED